MAMPKKTREQKLRAQQKRLKHLDETLFSASPAIADTPPSQQESQTITAAPSYRLPALQAEKSVSPKIVTQNTSVVQQDISYVRKDLTRIIFLTAAILVIEFSVFWLVHFEHILGF